MGEVKTPFLSHFSHIYCQDDERKFALDAFLHNLRTARFLDVFDTGHSSKIYSERTHFKGLLAYVDLHFEERVNVLLFVKLVAIHSMCLVKPQSKDVRCVL